MAGQAASQSSAGAKSDIPGFVPLVRRQNKTQNEKLLKQLSDGYAQTTGSLQKELGRPHKLPVLLQTTGAVTCPLIQESLINHDNYPTRLSKLLRRSGAIWPYKKISGPHKFMGDKKTRRSPQQWKPNLRPSRYTWSPEKSEFLESGAEQPNLERQDMGSGAMGNLTAQ